MRGKSASQVEFGSKLGVSLDNGFARLNTFSWDAYSEGKDLKKQVEDYKELHGYYPDLVQVHKAYSTKENRQWLKERNIRITAPPPGRKPKVQENAYQKRKKKKEKQFYFWTQKLVLIKKIILQKLFFKQKEQLLNIA